jgi:phage shock protein A
LFIAAEIQSYEVRATELSHKRKAVEEEEVEVAQELAKLKEDLANNEDEKKDVIAAFTPRTKLIFDFGMKEGEGKRRKSG